MDFADKLRAFAVKSAYRRRPSEARQFDDADRAALVLASERLRPIPSPDADVVFLISLMERSRAGDWRLVSRNLRRTLESLLNQTDGRWRVIVCCGARPEAFPEDDRIVFLPYDAARYPATTEIEPGSGDKGAKRLQILDHIDANGGSDGYAFAIDADDVLARDVVHHMRTTRAPGGYVIESGLDLDLETGTVTELGPRGLSGNRMTPMWSQCGTGTALYYDLRPSARLGTRLVRTALMHNHRRAPILAALAGFPPRVFPFHAGINVANNGTNVTGRTPPRAAPTLRGGPDLRAILSTNFDWDAIEARTAAAFPPPQQS